MGDGADTKFGAKFLINYNEKANNTNELEIISRYTLEKSTGINKLVYVFHLKKVLQTLLFLQVKKLDT